MKSSANVSPPARRPVTYEEMERHLARFQRKPQAEAPAPRRSHEAGAGRAASIPAPVIEELRVTWSAVHPLDSAGRNTILLLFKKCDDSALALLKGARIRHVSLMAFQEIERRAARS